MHDVGPFSPFAACFARHEGRSVSFVVILPLGPPGFSQENRQRDDILCLGVRVENKEGWPAFVSREVIRAKPHPGPAFLRQVVPDGGPERGAEEPWTSLPRETWDAAPFPGGVGTL